MREDARVVQVTLYAGARAAAGVSTVEVQAGTLRDVLAAVVEATRPELAPVLDRCSVLVDGLAERNLDRAVRDGESVDVLPPFAGG